MSMPRPRPPQELAKTTREMTHDEVADMNALLKAPFHPNLVDWRPGSFAGKSVVDGREMFVNQSWSYVDPREVRARLDGVVGFGFWSSEIRIIEKSVLCDISILFPWGWVTRTDGTHIGDVEIDTSRKETGNRKAMADFEKEKGNIVNETKGSYSIAFKRAASTWGVASYLYDLPKLERMTTQDKQFFPWFRIEMWLVAAGSYEDWWEKRVEDGKADSTKLWAPEQKGADFARWCRMMRYDLSEIINPNNSPVFETPEKLVRFCEQNKMDPDRVSFSRKPRQSAKTTPAQSSAAPLSPPSPSTPSTSTAVPANAPTQAPAVPAEPTPTPAPMAATQSVPTPPVSATTTPPTSSQPVDSKVVKAAEVQLCAKKTIAEAKSKDDLTNVIEHVATLNKDGTLTVMETSGLLDLVYARLVDTVNKDKTITGDEAKTIYNTYCTTRKTIDVAWQPPSRNKK